MSIDIAQPRVGAKMNSANIEKFTIVINAEESTPDELDAMTRQLLSELQDIDIASGELAHTNSAQIGTKAVDPVTIGAITIAILPTLLPKVVEFIQAWALRGQGRTVKFNGKIAGQTIQFEGTSDELQKLITTLSGN